MPLKSARIQVPASLRAIADGRPTVPAQGGTVRAALLEFGRLDRSVESFLFLPDGRRRRSIAVFVNGVDVRNLDGDETALRDGDLVSIAASMAGG